MQFISGAVKIPAVRSLLSLKSTAVADPVGPSSFSHLFSHYHNFSNNFVYFDFNLTLKDSTILVDEWEGVSSAKCSDDKSALEVLIKSKTAPLEWLNAKYVMAAQDLPCASGGVEQASCMQIVTFLHGL